MSKSKRIPKTLHHKLEDLDAHLFIVRENLRKLNESISHMKVLSAELRTLLCLSSGTEGLLWRLVDELGIDDRIFLHVQGDLIEDHPLSQGLQFCFSQILRGGTGFPHDPPDYYSLREIIKERQALVVGGKPIKHEYLIKAVSQQMGSAHECDGLEQMLIDLKSLFIGGVEPYISVLATNAELTLEIGERVLEKAEIHHGHKRHHHKDDYGNLSIVVSLRIKQQILGNIPIFNFNSYIGAISIFVSAIPSGVEFTIKKHASVADVLVAKYPEHFSLGQHLVFVFSYCSRTKQARTIVDGVASDTINFDAGWMCASDFSLVNLDNSHPDFIEKFYALSYEKLLSSEDSKSLSELPPNGYGIWKYDEEIKERGEFPE